jgi:hypothetical protein
MQASMSDRHESTRLQLLELGIEFITFCQYWYNDETFPLHAKAWTIDGIEMQLSDVMWEQTRWALHNVFKPVHVEANEKVFGWNLRNNSLQTAARNLEFTHEFGDYDSLDVETRVAYEQTTQVWGIAADPNYKYDVSENLKIMLDASRWSTEVKDAETWLELYLNDNDEFVRSSIAANPNVSEENLVQLGYDHSSFVRNSVRMNPATPRWLLDSLGGMLE